MNAPHWARPSLDLDATDHGCGVTDCGQRRCFDCDERMACYGPEPRACGVTCCDCPCSCTACLRAREDMRDELLSVLAREGSW